MSYAHPIPKEIEVTDRFGDTRIIHQTPNGLKLKRVQLTPVIALNQAVALIVAERIHTRRLAKGWSLAELADRAGLPGGKARMWEIENGIRETGRRFGTVYALAIALGCEATDLMPAMADVSAVASLAKRSVVSTA